MSIAGEKKIGSILFLRLFERHGRYFNLSDSVFEIPSSFQDEIDPLKYRLEIRNGHRSFNKKMLIKHHKDMIDVFFRWKKRRQQSTEGRLDRISDRSFFPLCSNEVLY